MLSKQNPDPQSLVPDPLCMSIIFHHYEHRAALPWLCYEKNRKKIIFRLLCPAGTERVVLLSGDPYDWYDSKNNGWLWRFFEVPLHAQFSGAGFDVYRAEIDLPESRRLKYGFKIKNSEGEFYFSENGIEPYSNEAVNRSHNHFVYPFVHDTDSPSPPSWAEKTVWYQIFPDRFNRKEDPKNSPPVKIENWKDGKPSFYNFFGGNISGIREKLPWLSELGISGVYLTPVFRSPSNHKYDTEDYFSVDPLFGNLDELKTLVKEAHDFGIRVMLDFVFNHAGITHPFWQDVLTNQENSPYKDYFHIRHFPVRHPSLVKSRDDLDFHAFAFFHRMPKWNTENPKVREYFFNAANFWIKECNIDGMRLDVANEVSFDFWKEFSRTVRAEKPDLYITGEVWHDASAWINSNLFDAVMNYPLGNAVSEFFLENKISPETFTSRLFSVLARYSDMNNRSLFNLLDSHDTERALTRAGASKQALKNAFTMLFLLPGSPCIYYGTETGMEGGRDPDCRRPMIWDENLQDAELRSFFKRLIAFRKRCLDTVNHSAIYYYSTGEIHFWDFSGGGNCLTAAYNEKDESKSFAVPGTLVFGPEAELNRHGAGELPPQTLLVFKREEV